MNNKVIGDVYVLTVSLTCCCFHSMSSLSLASNYNDGMNNKVIMSI